MLHNTNIQGTKFHCFNCSTSKPNGNESYNTGKSDESFDVIGKNFVSVSKSDPTQVAADLYCGQCSMFICTECTSYSKIHYRHEGIASIEEVFSSNVEKIKATLTVLSQSVELDLQNLEMFTGYAQSVSKYARTFVRSVNEKLNDLVSLIESIRVNLVLATLHHAQVLQDKAASIQARRRFGIALKQQLYQKRKLEKLTVATLREFETAKKWANKVTTCGQHGHQPINTTIVIGLPSELKEIYEIEFIPVKKHLATALKTAELFATRREVYKRLMVIGGFIDFGAAIYDDVKDSWHTTAPMKIERLYSAAVNWDGKVAVAGGNYPATASVELYNPKTNRWTTLPDLKFARYNHGFVNLSGCLYVIGGRNEHELLRSVEKYDPRSKSWNDICSLPTARAAMACATFQSTAIVIGGYCGGDLAQSSCELFVPERSQCIVAAAPLKFARMYHAAATHADSVYVFGGLARVDLESEFYCVAEMEEYNWHADEWTVLRARLGLPRYELAAVSLNGLIYIVGGRNDDQNAALDVVECFHVKTRHIGYSAPLPHVNRAMVAVSFSQVGVRDNSLHYAEVEQPVTTKTTAKQVLLCVGGNSNDNSGTGAVVYDCDADTWRPVASTKMLHNYTAAAMWYGKTVVAGGSSPKSDSVEQFDPETNAWTNLPNLLVARGNHSLVNLNDNLYVVGGSDGEHVLNSVERFDANKYTWVNEATLCMARKGLACANCRNRIVACGGTNADNNILSSCELYDTVNGNWKTIASLNIKRRNHAAAELNYFVYAFGGWGQKGELAETEQYDADANKWTLLKARLQDARFELAAACVQSHIYILGGRIVKNNHDGKVIDQELDAVEKFNSKNDFSSVSKLPVAQRAHAVACCCVTEHWLKKLV